MSYLPFTYILRHLLLDLSLTLAAAGTKNVVSPQFSQTTIVNMALPQNEPSCGR